MPAACADRLRMPSVAPVVASAMAALLLALHASDRGTMSEEPLIPYDLGPYPANLENRLPRRTPDLVAWLRQQVEWRRQLALAACEDSSGHWFRMAMGEPPGTSPGRHSDLYDGEPSFDEDGDYLGGTSVVVYAEGRPSVAQFDHIEANDPRDVIARCEAELAILDEHQPVRGFDGEQVDGPVCGRCCGTNMHGETEGDPYPCTTVRLLGSGYKHRPGYQEAWKP